MHMYTHTHTHTHTHNTHTHTLKLSVRTYGCMIIYSYRSDIAEIEPALELLNTHGADFDMVQVTMYLVK